MGHKIQNLDGGAAITESTYTLQRRGVQHLLVVAETMTSLIEASVVSLVASGPAGRVLPISVCPDPDERARALEVLDAGGYIGVIEIAVKRSSRLPTRLNCWGLVGVQSRNLLAMGFLFAVASQVCGPKCALWRLTMTWCRNTWLSLSSRGRARKSAWS